MSYRIALPLLLILGLAVAPTTEAQPPCPGLGQLVSSLDFPGIAPDCDDRFGRAVAIHGDLVLSSSRELGLRLYRVMSGQLTSINSLNPSESDARHTLWGEDVFYLADGRSGLRVGHIQNDAIMIDGHGLLGREIPVVGEGRDLHRENAMGSFAGPRTDWVWNHSMASAVTS